MADLKVASMVELKVDSTAANSAISMVERMVVLKVMTRVAWRAEQMDVSLVVYWAVEKVEKKAVLKVAMKAVC